MHHAISSWAAFGLPFLLTMLPAQAPPTQAPPQPHALGLRTACGLHELDGTLWGVGPDYKAAFRDGGVEFTPALGKRAPRNLPLSLRLAAMGRSGALGNVAPVAPTAHDLQVRYDRGSFVERYDVSARGIAQSFVFGTAPAGSGDLVVRLDLTTELPLVAQDADGLRFALPDLGGVTIGVPG